MPPQLPYTWLNPTLMLGSTGLILAALALVVFSFVSRRFSRRRLRYLALASFLIGILLGASNYGLIFFVQLPSYARQVKEANQNRYDLAAHVKVGQSAPAFRIKALDGTEIATDDLRGKVVLLSFFATWCGPCLLELPHLQEIWNAHGNQAEFSMLVIGREETDATLAAFKTKHGYSFPMAADPDGRVYSLYAKQFIRCTYLISKDGTVILSVTGYDDERLDALKRELAKQLSAMK